MHESNDEETPFARALARRQFVKRAAQGTLLTTLGGIAYGISDLATAEAAGQKRPDGRPRLPPGQRVLSRLKPMGGIPGSPAAGAFRLKIHGMVTSPKELDFAALRKSGPESKKLDVHCVTGWSLLGGAWTGVSLKSLAEQAGIKKGARHLIIEGAHGYSANVPLDEALSTDNLLAWEHEGRRLGRAHGAPVRAVIPNLYFWKSAKWITGLRFTRKLELGYWENRGYHAKGDPWREERYS